jgi:hypothetical protein
VLLIATKTTTASVSSIKYLTTTKYNSKNKCRHTFLWSPSSLSSSAAGCTLDGKEIRGPITPLGNFIVVKFKDTLQATSGGILLPDQSKNVLQRVLLLKLDIPPPPPVPAHVTKLSNLN